MSGHHEPVLLAETLGFLCNGPGLYLDATLGDGGHAAGLLAAEPLARLLGTDRDPEALACARLRLRAYGDRVIFAHAAFRELPRVHREQGGERFAGALFDLGVSSRQIDRPERGMSFRSSGPLDLRMDPTRGEPALERLGRVDPEDLAHVLREHGDLANARRLAHALVVAARSGRLATTADLAAVVDATHGGHAHPRRLAQVFQALRIWINDEDAELDAALEWLPEAMRENGVVVTLAYHSGEDRKIKQAIRGDLVHADRRRPPSADPKLPPPNWQPLTGKVVTPADEEVARNPRARSARLRAFRRTIQ